MLPSTANTSELVDRGGAPDTYDPSQVYRDWAPMVGRWAHQLGGPSSDVEDVVHDVFLTAYQNLPRFRGECRLSTWLFRITHSEIARRRRKERIFRWLFGDDQAQALEVPSAETGALDALQRDQEVRGLYRALDRLKERDRTVLILFEIEGLSGEEIARLMGAKVGTVWTWLHRARAQLLAKLGGTAAKGAQ